MSIIQGNAHTSAGGGYQIERSLRFNSADSAYLNRTPASASNRKTWTWSGWVKRSALGATQGLFGAYSAANNTDTLWLGFSGGDLFIISRNSDELRRTTQVFRDVSAWYHIVVALDTTQATANDRVKVYLNGTQITAFTTTNNPTQNDNQGINQAAEHRIGRRPDSTDYLNSYLTEVNFIDGQALTPSSFGETDANTGVWKPKAFSGTYGTNGFYLKFADNSGTTSTTLGKDSSGNGNNWTPNNFSVTAGAGNDSLVDSPTSYGTDTGVGGEVRGNYATLNPLAKGADASLSNGNLDVVGSGTLGVYATVRSTIQLPTSGKWYCEFRINAIASGNPGTGILADGVSLTAYTSSEGVLLIRPKGSDNNYPYWVVDTTDASVRINTTAVTAGNIFQVIYDADNLKVWMGINNTYYGISGGSTVTVSGTDIANGTNPAYTLSSTKRYYFGGYVDQSTDGFSANFGQRAFAYTAPSGFKALCTQNLPTPTIGATSTTQANDYMNVVTYTGTGSTRSVTGVGFQPGFVWIKGRSTSSSHHLFDAVRGVPKVLFTDGTYAEETRTNSFTSFDSDGFTVGSSSDGNTNVNTTTYVAWNWKANGAGSSNTAGSITSTVSASTTSGFSIVQWTGSGANGTVGHGLGVAPQFMFMKNKTNSGTGWPSYHAFMDATAPQNYYMSVADTAGKTSASNAWNNTAPTSSVFSVGSSSFSNGGTMIAYVFAPVAGYSAFGSYVGNDSADGPFVFCGFRPRWIIFKNTTNAGSWVIFDTARDTYNPEQNYLFANQSTAENGLGSVVPQVDYLSNGFKIRANNANAWMGNQSGSTFIYAAFAETPAKFSLAR